MKPRAARADNGSVPTHPPPLPQVQAPVVAPVPAPAHAPTLTPDHLQQLAAARARGRKIGRAVGVARFDGWSVATFAFLTALFGLTSPSSLLLGGLMGLIAFIELRAAGRLRRLEPEAARTLGINQIALGSLLVAYATWRIYCELTGAGAYAEIAATDVQLAEMLKPVEDLTRLVTLALYGGLISFAILAQGAMALYYFTRAGHVRDYVTQTPPWVVTVQQTGSYM